MNRHELVCSSFPDLCGGWPEPDFVFEMTVDDDVLSHVDLYWRSVEVGMVPIRVAAIGQVCTDTAWRNLGLASTLLTAAHHRAVAEGVSWAALWSDHQDFYSRFGYRQVGQHHDFLVAPLIDRGLWDHWDFVVTDGKW